MSALPPLREAMPADRAAGPLAMVIFGGTGDLSRRKLLPSLYRLFLDDLLPAGFALVGVAREPIDDDRYRAMAREAVAAAGLDLEQWPRFAERLAYVGTTFEDPRGFARLAERLESLDRERGTAGNRLFYLAVPPVAIATVVEQLGRAALVYRPDAEPWSRVVVEKPFGHDLDSARELNQALRRVFDESQLFRIDHYLGKETVQNLLVFRFANVLWEPVWNRQYVDRVEITVAESVGVGTRAGYYEGTGALRDMVQSHLLQLLSLVAMEPPASYAANPIRDEKSKVLCATRPVTGEAVVRDTVRGYYEAGRVGDETVRGYRAEPGVDPRAQTETFVALRLYVDNWRWAGVPFLLRTGKRLAARATEIVVHFRPAPHPILDTVENDRPAPNRLVLRIQPHEEISLRIEAKVPGLAGPLRPVSMDFNYPRAFPGARSPAAYERLLLDAMLGDATLFARHDETMAAWHLITPILEAWSEGGLPELCPYAAGGWGPADADRLVAGAAGWTPPLQRGPQGES